MRPKMPVLSANDKNSLEKCTDYYTNQAICLQLCSGATNAYDADTMNNHRMRIVFSFFYSLNLLPHSMQTTREQIVNHTKWFRTSSSE